jgi:hypothetical protein
MIARTTTIVMIVRGFKASLLETISASGMTTLVAQP